MYCNDRNNSIDAETFVSFYQSKGWLVGKSKMKCWKSSMITWEKREAQNKRSSHVHAATLVMQGINIDTNASFDNGLEQIAGLLN